MKEILAFYHLQEALEEIGKEIRNNYQDLLISPDERGFNRIATGNLLNSVDFLVLRGNRNIWVELHLEDYWKYLEYGTQPHWPPVKKNSDGTIESPILDWIKIKPVLPRAINGKLPTQEQLAYLIGRKISKEGTPAYMYLNKTIDSLNNWISRKIEDAVTQDLEEDVTFIFVKYFK